MSRVVRVAGLATLCGCNSVCGLNDLRFETIELVAGAGGGGADGAGAGGSGGSPTSGPGGGGGSGGTPAGCEAGPAWVAVLGDDLSDVVHAAAATPDGGVVLGGSFVGTFPLDGRVTVPTAVGAPDAYVVKLDEDGQPRWLSSLAGDATQRTFALAVHGDGSVVAVGATAGAAEAGTVSLGHAGGLDAFVLTHGPEGVALEGGVLGDEADQQARGVSIAPGGLAVVAGDLDGTLSLGELSITATGETDAFIVGVPGTGQAGWLAAFFADQKLSMAAMATDPLGNAVIVGSITNESEQTNAFVAKITSDGELIFARELGGSLSDGAFGVATDGDETVVVGHFSAEVDFGGGVVVSSLGGTDAFVARLDAAGETLAAFGLGSLGDDAARAVAIGADGRVVVAGQFVGDLDIGERRLPNTSALDVFVAIFEPDGAVVEACAYGGPSDQVVGALTLDTAGRAIVATTVEGSLEIGGSVYPSAGGQDVVVFALYPPAPADRSGR